MKKILGLAVAVAFVATAAFVVAEEQKAPTPAAKAPAATETVKVVEKAKGVEVKATETVKTTATGKVEEKAKVVEKAPGLKEEIKVTEKFDYNTCLKACAAGDTACKAKCDNLKKSFEGQKVAVEKKAPVAPATTTTKPATKTEVKKEEKKN